MLDRAKTFDANTHELAAEYRGAVRATLPAGISAADEEAFWRAMTDSVAVYFAMVERRQRRPAKGELERWQRIGDLVDELGKELRAVRRQTRWDAADPMLSNRTLEALAPLKSAAEGHVAGYAAINEASSKGRDVAQHFLYGAILDLWCGLGQPLRYGRQASKSVGPLVRFFTACAGHLLGDDMPTTRGIADIIERERKRLDPKYREQKQRERKQRARKR